MNALRAALVVFTKEFRENLRERRTVITALILGPLLGPVLFSVLLNLQIHRSAAAGDAAVPLALAHAERAPNLVAYLTESGMAVNPVPYDREGARAAVASHRHARVLLVPEGYAHALAAGTPAPLELYQDASDPSAQPDTEHLRAVLAQYSGALARLRILARGVDPLVLSPIAVQDYDVSTPASRSVLLLGVLSYLMLLTMLMGGVYLAIDATAGERERGTLESLLTLPVRRSALLAGKMLATCAYMVISLALTVLTFAVLLRFVGLERFGMSINFGPRVGALVVLYCLPLVPVGAALMTIVAAFTRTYREAQSWLGLTILLPTLPLVFAGTLGLRPTLPLMAVPSLSQHFLITGLLRAEPLPLPYLALSVGATLALALILTLAAAGLYRRESLIG